MNQNKEDMWVGFVFFGVGTIVTMGAIGGGMTLLAKLMNKEKDNEQSKSK